VNKNKIMALVLKVGLFWPVQRHFISSLFCNTWNASTLLIAIKWRV